MSAKRGIQARRESRREKPAERPPAAGTRPPATGEICAGLWGLCSPRTPPEYLPPLAGLAASLAARLELAVSQDPKHAAAASRLKYEECAMSLMRTSPQIYEVLTEIKGLAAIETPGLAVARPAGMEKGFLPGEALVYDTLAYDTLACDTLACDTLARDTLARDTLARDTLARVKSEA